MLPCTLTRCHSMVQGPPASMVQGPPATAPPKLLEMQNLGPHQTRPTESDSVFEQDPQ